MPLDAICMTAVAAELKKTLLGGKIDKVYQPGRDEVVLAIRGAGENVKLLLSASPAQPRMHLTSEPRENPAQPPMFCMLLRKHLVGGRILDLCQPPLERVIQLKLEVTDELGDRVPRTLVLEALGRRANVILLDAEDRIVDCLRRVDGDMSAQRQVLPGMFYRLPPPQDRENPMDMEQARFQDLFNQAPEEAQLDKWLLNTFGGLSPLVCRELCFRATGETDTRLSTMDAGARDKLVQVFFDLVNTIKEEHFTPTLLLREGKGTDYSFFPVLQYGPGTEVRTAESFSKLLDAFYASRDTAERVGQKGQDLQKAIRRARERTARRIGQQEQELGATLDRERKRELGDLLTSNFHAMEKGITSVRVLDYYDPEGGEAEIPLDPLLTPQQNAAKYYKEYNKAKTAEKMLTEQLEKGRRELDYLDSVLEAIALAEGERDLMEVRQELTETGYVKRNAKAAQRMKTAVKPIEFRSSSGLRISVGKNNLQNDLLTCKSAGKGDLWLHTQKIHGSHVILWTGGSDPDLQSVTEAASLAAWFSQARDGKKVPVDYTPVKFVKKPAGARPGMVVYTTCQTAYVDPDGDIVKRLRLK